MAQTNRRWSSETASTWVTQALESFPTYRRDEDTWTIANEDKWQWWEAVPTPRAPPATPGTAATPVVETATMLSSAERVSLKPSRAQHALDFFRGLATREQLAYLAVMLVQSIAALALLGVIFSKVYSRDSSTYLRPVQTYIAMFALSMIYSFLLSADGLRTRNVTQLVALVLFQVAILVYAALMGVQIRELLWGTQIGTDCREGTSALDVEVCAQAEVKFHAIQSYVWAIPAIVGAGLLAQVGLTWRLYLSFGWQNFYLLGGDRRLQKMYRNLLTTTMLLKFALFFMLGYLLQLLTLVELSSTAEMAFTIIAVPLSIFLGVGGIWCLYRERRWMAVLLLVGEVSGAIYLSYKLFALCRTWSSAPFVLPKRTILIFNIASLSVLVLTSLYTLKGLRNFSEGLSESLPPYLPPTSALHKARAPSSVGIDSRAMTLE